MNRYDERRRGSHRGEDYRFEEDEAGGRTGGDADRQPFSDNPYGYYPGQDRPRGEWRERRDWQRGQSMPPNNRSSSQSYGQREPYNARSGSPRSRWGGPWNDDKSRYSESQYGMRRSRFEPYGGDAEPEFGEGPFADTSESPRYFGSRNYGEGGSGFTGGYDQRSRRRYPGSLGEDTLGSSEVPYEQRRYRTGPKGYVRSDERIREDISERLMMADSIDSSEVTVVVKDGKVTLEGTVPTRSMKHAIEDLADYTGGVKDVDNRIRVERAGETQSAASSVSSTPMSGKTTKQ